MGSIITNMDTNSRMYNERMDAGCPASCSACVCVPHLHGCAHAHICMGGRMHAWDAVCSYLKERKFPPSLAYRVRK